MMALCDGSKWPQACCGMAGGSIPTAGLPSRPIEQLPRSNARRSLRVVVRPLRPRDELAAANLPHQMRLAPEVAAI